VNIDAVIKQLRTLASIFGGRVAGAAEFAQGVHDNTWLETPAAYVIPREDTAGPNKQQNGIYQIVTERFDVVVSLDNRADRRGQASVSQLDVFKAEIFKALLGWRPDSTADAPDYQLGNPFVDRASRGLSYAGGALQEFDRARFFWAFTFDLDITINGSSDGWQPPQTPLTEIQGNPPAGNFGSFDVQIPQDTSP
jgi:hypothetical protein